MKTRFQSSLSNATCTALQSGMMATLLQRAMPPITPDAPLPLVLNFVVFQTAGLYKFNSVDPQLESGWFQPLNL
jgi:hypothetical protein